MDAETGRGATKPAWLRAMAPFPHPPAWARDGIAALCAADHDLARIEAAAGPLPWRTRPQGFEGLLHAIVAQQISSQAAAAIWQRLLRHPGAIDPAGLLAMSDDMLRASGFSRPKIKHARALAEAFHTGQIDATRLADLDDAAVIASLTALPGIGPWTAEIYLLFALQRPDVMPAGDVALQAAFADLKSLPARPDPAGLRALTAPYAPHRALAARLLWHWWRHITGRPSTDDLAAEAATDPPAADNDQTAPTDHGHAATADNAQTASMAGA